MGEYKSWEIWQGWGSWGQGDDGPSKPELVGKVMSRSFRVAALKYNLMTHFNYMAKADEDGTLDDKTWNLEFHYDVDSQRLMQCWPFFPTEEEAWTSFPSRLRYNRHES